MEALTMTRKRRTITLRIDDLVWTVVESSSKAQGISASRWVERYIFDGLKNVGLIPPNESYLGETRGGDRYSGKDEDDEPQLPQSSD